MRLTVLPVALHPEGDDPLSPMAVSVLSAGSSSSSAVVEDVTRVLPQARRMLAGMLPSEIKGDMELRRRTQQLESVGVDYTSGVPNLLFSAVLPIAASELDGEVNDWVRLAPSQGDVGVDPADPGISALVRYWREQLVHTTAALDFLPEFFTVSQVRAVYSSVWGEEQADANFQRWLLSARDVEATPVVTEVASERVQQSTQDAFVQRMASALGAEPVSIARNWDPKYVGLSAGVAALGGGMKAIPAAAVAGAIVGSLVSWQRARGAGRPPAWFRRTNAHRVELQTWYPVRPNFNARKNLGAEAMSDRLPPND